MGTAFHQSRRLSCSGVLCTVRYQGPVQGTRGEWLGVEWDEASRGKHSGEHEGLKYFQCRSKKPYIASFIRPTRAFDQPLGFLEALHQKYASESSFKGAKIGGNEPREEVIEISGKIVQEVGFERIRLQLATFQELRIVILEGLSLAGLSQLPYSNDGDDWIRQVRRIEEVCPKVAELDLSRNLLECWADVVGICKALPMLRSLKINNRFKDLSTTSFDSSLLYEAFYKIKELHLDDTLMTWEDITTLSAPFPSLATLSFSSNDLAYFPSSLLNLQLTTLTLSNNAITTLSALHPLTHLPNLQSLSLHSNYITTISPPSASPPIFSSLLTLDLSQNLIPFLLFISHLPASFPLLTSLRTSHNPFNVISPETVYILTLARIPTLRSLNYSNISIAERQNAELYYLSTIAKELSSTPPEAEPEILSQHPQYPTLCYLHGTPSITRLSLTQLTSTSNENTFNARLRECTFYLPAAERSKAQAHPIHQRLISTSKPPKVELSPPKEETHTTPIPRTANPYRLKSIVGPLFNLSPMYTRLIWETGEWDPVGARLSHDDEARWSVSSLEGDSEDDSEAEDIGKSENNPKKNSSDPNPTSPPTNTLPKEPETAQGQDADGDRDRDLPVSPSSPASASISHRPPPPPQTAHKGKWVRREVELVDGTREVGFWIEEREARVRVEVRAGTG